MKQLEIIKCSDSLMWYADSVGSIVELVREYDDCYMSREHDGYANIILKKDARIVERCQQDNCDEC